MKISTKFIILYQPKYKPLMNTFSAKDFGLKLAKTTENGFVFYPNKMWRAFSFLIIFNCTPFAIAISFLLDIKFNLYLILFVTTYVVTSSIMFIVSLKRIELNKKTNKLIVHNFTSKREIQIKQVTYIIRMTTKEYVDLSRRWRSETNIRFFIEIDSSERIQLYWPLKLNKQTLNQYDFLVDKMISTFGFKKKELFVNKIDAN